jgi:hypothetical protein
MKISSILFALLLVACGGRGAESNSTSSISGTSTTSGVAVTTAVMGAGSQ